jgi:isopentenyl-diphosphate delta-isomerase
MEHVVLVDRHDRPLGVMEKLAAHREGRLHRALSVVLRSADGTKLLLQRRASCKYHSGGAWTNTCCSHPRPGEDPAEAAVRRLREEMGIEVDALEPLFTTIYRASVGTGLTEYEYVHVFGRVWDGAVNPDPAEVEDYAWFDAAKLRQDIASHPERYSVWFKTYVDAFWDRMAGQAQPAA